MFRDHSNGIEFPQFKRKFDAYVLFFQVCHFLVTAKLHLCLTRPYSIVIQDTALFQAQNYSVDSAVFKPSGKIVC